MSLPILYSYRRCPYAMRARMALRYANIAVQIIEISLRDKPSAMLQASPKGTVPVLVLTDGRVIEQSLEIMDWALNQTDPLNWAYDNQPSVQDEMQKLIAYNDSDFKAALDRYKYPERYPGHNAEVYRAQGEQFLQQLENKLNQQRFLLGERISKADIAIFPFIRQFARVDQTWFNTSPYPRLQAWLSHLCESELFQQIMQKKHV